MSTHPDPDLIAAHLAGDRRAFEAIYDRYAAGLYDLARVLSRNPDDAADLVHDAFVIAAQRLGQLREPERLKAWLCAIVRHEAYRSSRRRSRERPTEAVAEMAPPSTPDPAMDLDAADLSALVHAATAGLDERDRVVLELVARQRLEGRDLADALGVSVQQSYSMVHRMRQRFVRAAGAVVVARTGRQDCAALAELLRDWDGRYDVLTRKRVARHVDDCATCEETRKRAGLLELFGAHPVSALPAGLRARVFADAFVRNVPIALGDDGFPQRRRVGRVGLVGAIGVVVVLGGSTLGAALLRVGERPSVQAVVEGAAVAASGTSATSTAATSSASTSTGSTSSTTFVAATTSGESTTPGPTAASDPAVTESTAQGAPATSRAAASTSASAAPPQQPVVPPPTSPQSPLTTSAPTTAAPTTAAPTTVAPTIAPTTAPAPPVVTMSTSPNTGTIWTLSAKCAPTTLGITATVSGSTPNSIVILAWSGPGAATGSQPMALVNGVWRATLGPFQSVGKVDYRVTARHGTGPIGSSAYSTVGVQQCP